MNEDERWLYLEGPEPERLGLVLDALREPSPESEADAAARVARTLAKLDARLAPAEPPAPRPARVQEEAPDPASEPRPTPEPPPSLPPVVRAPASVAGTLPLVLPEAVRAQLAALPFVQPAPEPAAGRGHARTLKVPVMRPALGGTLPVGDDSIAHTVAALPFAGAAAAAVVPIPQLTVEAYASLCAELSVSPERAGEILLRYHVPSAASRQALDAQWQAWLAERPDLRAAFEEAQAIYARWLRAQRR